MRYVLERSAIDPGDPQLRTINGSANAETAINSEVEILTSTDLAEMVGEAVGPERICPNSRPADRRRDAARCIVGNLKVTALKGSNVILVAYRNRDPRLAQQVLEELVSRYFDKHLQIHRSLGAFEFVSRQASQVRDKLQHTEEALKKLKAAVGITSLEEGVGGISTELAKTQGDLHAAQVELAEERARISETEQAFAGAKPEGSRTGSGIAEFRTAQQYETLNLELSQLRRQQVTLMAKYTPENRAVQVNKAQIATVESRVREFESALPALFSGLGAKGGSQTPAINIISERARFAAIQARTAALENQTREIQAKADRLADVSTQIEQLERNREMEETNLKYLEVSLEKARVDEALDPSKIPNISVVQRPSPAQNTGGRLLKGAVVLAGGGVAAGLMLAFFVELVLDPTVKRRKDLENGCGIPTFMSIPWFATLATKQGASTPTGSFIRLQERLVNSWENNLHARKPKMIAIASIMRGGGASTIAYGLARALANAQEEKVLLVDMEGNFPNGEAIEEKHSASTVASVPENGTQPMEPGDISRMTASDAGLGGPREYRRFHQWVPEMRNSDFEYVILDMPPISENGTLNAIGGLLDRVLLVVEAEKAPKEVTARIYGELFAAKANPSVILNKVRTYGPKQILGEI